jgi:hypothetical protein
MSDDDDTNDDTEDYSAPVMVDPVAAAIALTDLVAEFSKAYKLVTTDKAKAARLRALARLDRRAVAAEQKFAAITAQAEQVQAALDARAAALEGRDRALTQREDAFAASCQEAHDSLAAYYNNLADMDRRLRYRIMASADLLAGFNEQLQDLPSWEIIRRMVPGLPADPPPLERDVASHPRIDALSDTFSDPNADRHGNVFLGTLTRDVSHRGAQ